MSAGLKDGAAAGAGRWPVAVRGGCWGAGTEAVPLGWLGREIGSLRIGCAFRRRSRFARIGVPPMLSGVGQARVT